jgi:hypothetical protein
LNDPAFVEIAMGLAERIQKDLPDAATDQERLRHAFVLCLGREPSSRELKVVEHVLAEETAERGDHRAPIIGTNAQPSFDPKNSSSRPWLTLARVLLNLDEFVTRE